MTAPQVPLTPHETAVLAAAAIGLTQETAARQLGTSSRTLRRLQGRAITKLGAASLVHAVAVAIAGGLVPAEHIQARTMPPVPPYDPLTAWQASRGRALTPDQIGEAARLRGQGLSYRKIGDRFGVAHDTVRLALTAPDRGGGTAA